MEGSGILCDPGLSISSPRLGDLCPGETTVLSQLVERRDSLASTVSSAYILSRRSSGISPCYSSRRSSQTSQPGGRLNNISSAGSYDPISTDLSRRSSEASQCGGLPSLLSLTPAQHYRLKARYAAATGGAPPTPLPNMDCMSLRTRMALLGDSHDVATLPINSPSVPRRCSDTSYAHRSILPHGVMGNITRRASDPVRRVGTEQHSLQQRYNSMSNVNPYQSLHPPASSRHFSQINSQTEGNVNRHLYPPRPPSISENVVMETMVGNMDNQNNGLDDAVMLTDDVVQYLTYQNGDSVQHGAAYHHHPGQSIHSFGSPQQSHYQRRLALVEGNMNAVTRQTAAPSSQQTFPDSLSDTKSQMPVQWNEVSSGTVDLSHGQTKQGSGRGNLTALQQKQNVSPFQNVNSNQQVGLMSHNLAHTAQQSHVQQNSEFNSQRINQRPPLHLASTEQANFLHGYHQVSALNDINVSMLSPSGKTLMAQPGIVQNNRVRAQPVASQSNATFPNHQGNYSQMNINQQSFGIPAQNPTLNGNHGLLQPRPPPEPKPYSRQPSGPMTTAAQQLGYPQSNFNPTYDTSEASPKKLADVGVNSTNTNGMFYTGQIHMFSSRSLGMSDAESAAMAAVGSPETNQVSSTVDSNGAEHPQIDFDIMLDDGDHSSLMSGTLSPTLLRSLSQNSSRLTTPRNSVTLPPVPAGIGNMAIADMSSMLTALAEESKFLNMMS